MSRWYGEGFLPVRHWFDFIWIDPIFGIFSRMLASHQVGLVEVMVLMTVVSCNLCLSGSDLKGIGRSIWGGRSILVWKAVTVQSEVYRLDGMRTQLEFYCIKVYHTGPILEAQAGNVWLWYAIIQSSILVVQEYTLFNKTIQEQKCDLIVPLFTLASKSIKPR